jgi:hypothetical protein
VDDVFFPGQILGEPLVTVEGPEQRVEQGGFAEAVFRVDQGDVAVGQGGEIELLPPPKLAEILDRDFL